MKNQQKDNKAQRVISILAFLILTLGMNSICSAQVHAQTENPKDDPQVIEKFASQIHNLVMAGEWWQLEQLCNEKADSRQPIWPIIRTKIS